MCEWAFIPGEREMQEREQPGGSGPQGVGEGDEHSWRLFLADEFARQAGECRMCSREEDERLGEVEGGASGSTEKRTNKQNTIAAGEEE
jgi:hypothetical protein